MWAEEVLPGLWVQHHRPRAALVGGTAATAFTVYSAKELMDMMPKRVKLVLANHPEHVKRFVEGIEYMNSMPMNREQQLYMKERMKESMVELQRKVDKDPMFVRWIDDELRNAGKRRNKRPVTLMRESSLAVGAELFAATPTAVLATCASRAARRGATSCSTCGFSRSHGSSGCRAVRARPRSGSDGRLADFL
mmetsp:Transcript_28687/g.78888  ORF Transcript_28687/g.78888 Transcript_28687/m.78888 type:complete len:193 (-) Transcript_28687:86-664(-)